jgi:predicted metal-dependent phosphoesterase TrpH
MRLDLHMHTTASDGAWSPAEVVKGAAAGGLDVIAITDHDTVAGVAPAQDVARGLRIHVIPGIEISSTHGRADIHVLGYFVDPESESMLRHGQAAGARRVGRMREMIERLSAQGIDVSYEAVLEAAGPDGVVIGRPHLARALVEAGHATSVWDAFDRLIGDEHEAFVPTHLLEPAGAVELVLAAGGIPVWAHPPAEHIDALLPVMMEAGLAGLEVYRPRPKKAQVLRLESICKTSGLLMSGGSDWHNPDHGRALGDFYVSADEIEGLLHAGGL